MNNDEIKQFMYLSECNPPANFLNKKKEKNINILSFSIPNNKPIIRTAVTFIKPRNKIFSAYKYKSLSAFKT